MQTIERFGLAKGLVAGYGALGTAVVGTVAASAITGGEASGFMWTRSTLVLVSAGIMYWLVALAERGRRAAYLRARLIAVAAPVALIGVDLIPGVCPLWFLLMQSGCALVLAGAAIPLFRLRARFTSPEQSAAAM